MRPPFRRLVLALTFGLLCGHAGVLWLAAHPHVDRLYRLYYLEQRFRGWDHGRGPQVAPGQVLDFRQPQGALSRRGWGEAENWATWSIARRAHLSARVPQGLPPRRLVFDLVPFVAPGKGLAAQRVRIQANGQDLGEFRLTEAAVLVLDLPPSVWASGEGWMLMDFEFPDAASPRSLGEGDDRRLLAVALRSLRIE